MRYIVATVFFFLAACSSLRTAYERFKDWADHEVALNTTINKLDYNPNYPLGRYLADSHHFTNKEFRSDGFWVYHYSRYTLFNKKDICYYHLVVDPGTNI